MIATSERNRGRERDASRVTRRGQVGIGTLVVFIAMVLVAAMAAGVLINTAGVLQTDAENTGIESQSQVTDRVVVTKRGEVAAGGSVTMVTGTTVQYDRIVLKGSDGSGGLPTIDPSFTVDSKPRSGSRAAPCRPRAPVRAPPCTTSS
nr:archaellin/type IV pilin N-terminal domain-containing protein [Halorussus litoreus]